MATTMLAEIRRLFEHAAWADTVLLSALDSQTGVPTEAIREFGHVLGADEIWLSRLEHRSNRAPVWPDQGLTGLEQMAKDVHRAFATYLKKLREPGLNAQITYTNSAGTTFSNGVKDVLLHVAMHGQYHRGKINLLLRQAGLNPAPTDYIAFIRGSPAARSR
jgi:uncharacterized damage-inducible protein DinB